MTIAVPHVSVYVFAHTYVSVHVCMCIHHVYNKVVSKFTITIIAKSTHSGLCTTVSVNTRAGQQIGKGHIDVVIKYT